MNYFRAVNDKQLGICLRMIYAEHIHSFVETVMNDKGKIEFHVYINAEEHYRKQLIERYEILIS